MSQAPSFIKPETKTASDDRLVKVRKLLADARDKTKEIEDINEKLEGKKKELNALLNKTLPDLFDELGINNLGLEAEGNLPAYDATKQPFYSANIASDWDQDKRDEAFAYLDSLGEGDLIKTEITVAFPREKRKEAKELIEILRDKGLEPIVSKTVHSSTLKAWLKNNVEKKHFTPDLSKIGGTVGTVVRLKAKEAKRVKVSK